MNTSTIICPKCKNPVSIDEALGSQLEESIKKEFELKRAEEREQERKKMMEWKESQEKKLGEELKKQLLEESELEQKHLKDELEEKKKIIQDQREKELALLKKQEEVEEKARNLELETKRQVAEERAKIQEDAEKRIKDEYQLTLAEKEKVTADLLKQIEDLKQKATQGSQQLQGEILELELEQLLKTEFPLDDISPVGKGINGADVIQTVRDPRGQNCGVIIWESKRTKTFGGDWIDKLKDNMRTAKADLAILVSSVYPTGMDCFGPKDGVYITDFANALPIAKLMRLKIIELYYAKKSAEGVEDKKQILWQYLTGNEFRQRVEAIVEAFSLMKQGLDTEKKYFQKKWAQEEKLIDRVVNQTIGMHGDLQGLIGSSLPQIKSLEMDNFELVETNQIEISTPEGMITQTTITETVIEEAS